MILVSVILVIVVTMLFLIISFKKLMDTETFSSYECGFNVNSLARMFFSFRFFLISILFLIFDIEIALLLSIPFLSINYSPLLIFFFFFFILLVGLIYEYYYGSLNWLNFISKA